MEVGRWKMWSGNVMLNLFQYRIGSLGDAETSSA